MGNNKSFTNRFLGIVFRGKRDSSAHLQADESVSRPSTETNSWDNKPPPPYSEFGIIRINSDFIINGLKHEISASKASSTDILETLLQCGKKILTTVLSRTIWLGEGEMPPALSRLILDISSAIELEYEKHSSTALPERESAQIAKQLVAFAETTHAGGKAERVFSNLTSAEQTIFLRKKREAEAKALTIQAAKEAKEQQAQLLKQTLDAKLEQARKDVQDRALALQTRNAHRQSLPDLAAQVLAEIHLMVSNLETDLLKLKNNNFSEAILVALDAPESYPDYDLPTPLPHGVDWRGAELLTLDWLKYLGFYSAVKTPPRKDGGIDVETSEYVIQTKNWERENIPVSSIREILGSASIRGKKAMFFSSSNYSPAAESEAALGGVALFVFNSHSGRLKPHNSQAEEIVTNSPNEMSPLAIANAKGLLESTLNCLDGGANSLHALADGVYAAGMRLDDPEWVLLNAIAAKVSQMNIDWASRKSRPNENAESSVRRHLSANKLVLIGTNIDDVLTEIRAAVGRIQKRPTQDTMIIAELNPQQY